MSEILYEKRKKRQAPSNKGFYRALRNTTSDNFSDQYGKGNPRENKRIEKSSDLTQKWNSKGIKNTGKENVDNYGVANINGGAPSTIDWLNSNLTKVKTREDNQKPYLEKYKQAEEIKNKYYNTDVYNGRNILCVIDGQIANIWGAYDIDDNGNRIGGRDKRSNEGAIGNDFIAVRNEKSNPEYYTKRDKKTGEPIKLLSNTGNKDVRGTAGYGAIELYAHADEIYVIDPKYLDNDVKQQDRLDLLNKSSSSYTKQKLFNNKFQREGGTILNDLIYAGVIIDADLGNVCTFKLDTDNLKFFLAENSSSGKTDEEMDNDINSLYQFIEEESNKKWKFYNDKYVNITIDMDNDEDDVEKIRQILDGCDKKYDYIKKALKSNVLFILEDAAIAKGHDDKFVPDRSKFENQYSQEFFEDLKAIMLEKIDEAIDLTQETQDEIQRCRDVIEKAKAEKSTLPQYTEEDLNKLEAIELKANRALSKIQVKVSQETFKWWSDNIVPDADTEYYPLFDEHLQAITDLTDVWERQNKIMDTFADYDRIQKRIDIQNRNIKEILKRAGFDPDSTPQDKARRAFGRPDIPGDAPANGDAQFGNDLRKKFEQERANGTRKRTESLEEGDDIMDNEQEFEEQDPNQTMINFIQMCWNQVGMLEGSDFEKLGAVVDDLKDSIYVAIGQAEKMIKSGDETKDIGDVAPNKDYPVGLADEPGDGENDRDGKEVLTELGEGMEDEEDIIDSTYPENRQKWVKDMENGTGDFKNVLETKKDKKEKKDMTVGGDINDVQKYHDKNVDGYLNDTKDQAAETYAITMNSSLAQKFEQKRLAEDKKFRSNAEDIDESYVSSIDFNF